ncbi:MAG: hypothetical protein JXR95_01750 [Deltaproteobacteria bacterium]|nr:hypothetical protein [Deltaproteobacteria bacterium]
MPRLSKGLLVEKRFEIIEYTGKDHWSDVYTAVERETQILVELHVLESLAQKSRAGADKLVELHRSLVGIVNRNLVETLSAGYVDPEKKLPYYVMKFIEGETLHDVISRSYPLGAPVDMARRILSHILRMLGEVHGNFFHGYINPKNVIISSVGRVMLKEFGILVALREHTDILPYVNLQDRAFLAPEAHLKGNILNKYVDIYSVGAIANYLISGKPPTTDHNPDLKPDTPEDVAVVLSKALMPRPTQRFETVMDMREEILNSLVKRKKSKASVIMVDLLNTFHDEDEEEKKYMVQKGRLDYGPYSGREIREKSIEELILPSHIVVNIETGFRKPMDKHPDFEEFMYELQRRMELKRRQQAEEQTEVVEKRQSRTLKLAFILGISLIAAVAISFLLYKTVIESSSGRRRGGAKTESEISIAQGQKDVTKKKGRRSRSRRGRRRRHSGMKNSSGSYGSSGDEIKVYALDNVQLSQTQILSIVDQSVINKIAGSCIPSSGRVHISYQISGRKGRVSYTSAKLDGVRNKKIARCAHHILRRLSFPKMNTDVSGFGSVSF